jgi:hypothetical protein
VGTSAQATGDREPQCYPGSYYVNYDAAPGERNVVSASALLGHVVNVYDDGARATPAIRATCLVRRHGPDG